MGLPVTRSSTWTAINAGVSVGGPQHHLLASLAREFILKTVIRTERTA